MLPFLAFPRHFTQTPIAKEGLRFLRKQMPARLRWWHMIEALLIMVCLVTAIVPAFIPIFTVRRMLAIYLPTVLLSWLVIARTILCGAALGSREQALGMWDDLVLTRMDAQQIILGKWWATVRYCWWGHAWMIVLRFITAYNVAAFFRFVPAAGQSGVTLGNICPIGMNAFCYGIFGAFPSSIYPIDNLYSPPLFLFGIVGVGVLIIFGLFELSLSAMFGVAMSISTVALNQPYRAIISRALLVIISTVVLILGTQYYEIVRAEDLSNGYGIDGVANDRRVDLLETIQAAVTPFVDQGILLTANFFRPFWAALPTFFQVRQGLNSVLGWLLYGLSCLIMMRFAIDTAVHCYASPGTIGAETD